MSDALSKSVIAIDFGTMYSRVAVYENEDVTIIPDEYGNLQIPSCVAFNEIGEVLFGHDAVKTSKNDSKCAIFGVKKQMNIKFDDWNFDEMDCNQLLSSNKKKDAPIIQIKCKDTVAYWAPEEIAALLLLKLKEMAEEYLGKTVKKTIITIPIYFNMEQRQAMFDAAEIAQLEVVQLFNDTAAAFLIYKLKKAEKIDKQSNVVFVDCGCECFQLSYLLIDKNTAENKYQNYCFYGGDEITECLFDYCAEMFIKKNSNKEIVYCPQAKHRLYMACEEAKRCLSTETETIIEVKNILDEISFCATITREQFEEICKDVFEEFLSRIKDLQNYLQENNANVDEVILLGGSLRIPKLQQKISDAFGGKTEINTNLIDDDTAVVFGAAIKTNYYSKMKKDDLALNDVAMWDLSIESLNNKSSKIIIEKGTPLPHSATFLLSELRDEKDDCIVDVNNKSLTVNNGKSFLLDFSNVLQNTGDIYKIEIVFCLDVNEILNVLTKPKGSNETTPVTIKNMRNVNKSIITNMARKCSTLFEQGQSKEKILKINAHLKMLLKNANSSSEAQQIEVTNLKNDMKHLNSAFKQIQRELQIKEENKNEEIGLIAEQSVIAYKENSQRERKKTEEINARYQLNLIRQAHKHQAQYYQTKREYIEKQETAERKILEEVMEKKNQIINEMNAEHQKIIHKHFLQLQAVKLSEYEKQKSEIYLLQSIATKDQLKMYAYEMLFNISNNKMTDTMDPRTIQEIKDELKTTLHWVQTSSEATQENCNRRLFVLQKVCAPFKSSTPSSTESSEEWNNFFTLQRSSVTN